MGKSELAGSNSVLTVVRSSGITTALIEHSLEYVSLQSFLSHSVERRGEGGDRRESSSLLEVVTDEVYCDRSAQ